MQTLTERLAGGGGPGRRLAAGAGAIVVVGIAITVLASTGAPAASKGQSSSNTGSGVTAIQRRDLVQTDTQSGTLGYANRQTVFNRLSGTITYLPRVGQVVKPGGTLYQVDGYPVILFNGSYPAFRTLTSGVTTGPDVEELNADLKAMGFDPYGAITVDRTWQAATTAAVERWQASIGQSQTGTITLGQVVFLPGPQLINTVSSTLGSTGGSGGGGSGASGTGSAATGASYTPNPAPTTKSASYYPAAAQPHAQFVDLTTSSTPAATAATAATTATTTPTTTTPTTTTPTTTTPTTPPTPTTPTTPTTTTTPLSATSPGGSTLAAVVKLLETQNKLLQAELLAARKSAAPGKSSAGSSGSGSSGSSGRSGSSGSGARSGGGAASSAGAASSGGGSSGGASSGGGASSSGAGGSSASAILTTSSTQLVVTVDLDATKQSEAKLHEPVTVQLPDGTTVNGKITAVSPVAQASSSSSGSSGGGGSGGGGSSASTATIPVTVSLAGHADSSALDQAAVSVNFQQQVARNVLSVPVTALLATQGGGYAVQEAAPPHRLIPVTPGLFAAGYVQISGPGVQDGMQVTDSQG